MTLSSASRSRVHSWHLPVPLHAGHGRGFPNVPITLDPWHIRHIPQALTRHLPVP